MNRLLAFCLGICLLCSACNSNTTSSQQPPVYFDVAAILQQNIAAYNKDKPLIKKYLALSGKEENLMTTDIDWEKELAPFMALDINKPAFRQSYSRTETATEKYYQLKPTEKGIVKELRVKFAADGQLQSIEGQLANDNFLYNSGKSMKLTFRNKLLQTYALSGWQQLFIGQKTTMQLQATKQ